MEHSQQLNLKPFSLLIKPVGSRCNIDCTYCFYRGTDELLGGNRHPVMPDHVLDRMIGDYLALAFPTSVFIWQGGEPTVAGLNFFRRVVEKQMAYGRGGQVVANALQTNGYVIDDRWAEFLAEYRFLVGLSLDGPPEIHNHHRITGTGHPTFDRIMKTAETLRRHSVEFNILCMITGRSEDHGRYIYEFLVGEGFEHLQFIPCVDYDPSTGTPSPYNVSPAGYGRFLCDMFDAWYSRDVGRVTVRTFESLVALLAGEEQFSICTMRKRCNHYLVVEKEGDVYPCDFFVSPQYYLGNLCETPLADLFCSDRADSFSRIKCDYPDDCLPCTYFDLCAGGCPKDRLCAGGESFGKVSGLCGGLQLFFGHTAEKMKELAESVRQTHEKASVSDSRSFASVGRNDPCPCGSGKKYKKCCMK